MPPFFCVFSTHSFLGHIKFQAGTHKKAISMSMDDYRKLVKPRVLEFSYHMMS